MSGTIGLFLVLLATLVAVPASAQDVPASQRPPCEIAPDEAYGLTIEQPVQVGGGPFYGKARQHRYLDALRGPQGQALTYKRTAAGRAPDGTIVDLYEVTHDGREKPLTLFLDWYHFNPLRAPKGFTCATAFDLGAPPVDPFLESSQLEKVAVEQGAGREFQPIPLSPDGSTKYGVMFDRFRLLGNAARAAASKGITLDTAKPPGDLAQTGMMVVAFPIDCDGRKVPARSVAIMDAAGKPLTGAARAVSADRAAKVLPGITIPEGAVVTEIQLQRPRNGDRYTVTYMEAPCGATQDYMTFRSTITPAKGVEMPPALLPEGTDPGPAMLLQVIVDTDGKIQRPEYIGGSTALLESAKTNVNAWKVEPARANGAPIATGVVLQVQFVTKK